MNSLTKYLPEQKMQCYYVPLIRFFFNKWGQKRGFSKLELFLFSIQILVVGGAILHIFYFLMDH